MHRPFPLLRQGLRHTWQHLVALALPPTCIGCKAVLAATEPVGFCATCYATLPWWNPAHILPPKLAPAVASFRAPCLYDEPLRTAILRMKFHDSPHLAAAFAKLLTPLVPADCPLIILPVPSHANRLRARKFNHAALLVRHLARLSGHPCNLTALTRTLEDKPQAEKTRAARLRLPATAFRVKPGSVAGHTVLLVDDIFTTGATTRACALALKRAGAARVHVLTLAYTAPR